jgi:antitoxin component YwqK of YwqJK toxin-antitoxin module
MAPVLRLSLVLLVACSSKGSQSSKQPPPAVADAGVAAVPTDAAPPPPPPPPDASTDPVNSAATAAEFWKQGDAACPEGAKLSGKRPKDRQVYCVGTNGMHGPSATFHDNGKLLELGSYDQGKREGLWTSWSPDGKKLFEAAYHRGNLHGPFTRWHPGGAKAEEGTYRDGRPDGTFRLWSMAGTELGTYVMKDGTGTVTYWHEDGSKSFTQPMVDGQPHGTTTYWHKNGQKAQEGRNERGEQVGHWVSWDENGKKRSEGDYRANNMEGPWTYYDEQGRIVRVDHYRQSSMWESIAYKDGKPLAKSAAGSACATDDGVRAAYTKATGRQLGGRDHPGCIERARHFPGIVFVGGFAHDRGCIGLAVLVDCAVGKIDPPAVLDRAGWKQLDAGAREPVAMSYLREIEFVWEGSIDEQRQKPAFTRGADGSLTVDFWTADPSGMQRGRTIRHQQYSFSPTGAVSGKELESKHVDD